MKEFVVYTALRLGLFFGCLAIVLGIWWAAAGTEQLTETQVFVSMVVAFLLSGVASYFLLNRFREQLARKVQGRAERATSRFEEMRSREDQDQ